MLRRGLRKSLIMMGALAVLPACGDASDGALGGSSGFTTAGTDSATGASASASDSGGSDSTGGGGSTGGEPPPEEEEDADFRVPRTSGRFVYSASELTDRVAVIDSDNLSIDVVNVGSGPTVVEAIPGQGADKGAVGVLCQASNEVAFVRTTANGVTTVELRNATDGANNLAAAPGGDYLIVYHDIDGPESLGAGSNQELTVLETAAEGKIWEMAVGANPRDVQFSDSGTLAYVVTDDGVNVIDLTMLDMIGKPDVIPVVLDPGIDPATLEIQISTSVGQALARVEGEDWVVVTDLATGVQTELMLPGIATDLDISGDGSFAILALPDPQGADSTVVEVPLPVGGLMGFTTHSVPGEYTGLTTIAPDGKSLILYTTQNPWEGAFVDPDTGYDLVLDPDGFFGTGTGSGSGSTSGTGSTSGGSTSGTGSTGGGNPPPDYDPRQRVTVARRDGAGWDMSTTLFMEVPVRSVGMAPDSKNAILLHHESPEVNPQAPWPYTLLDVSKAFPVKKLQMAEAKPRSILFTPDGSRAAVLLRDDDKGIRRIDRVNLLNFIVDGLNLGSPPEGAGYVESTEKIFVSQEHPAGRITFLGDDGSIQTVTGYELNDSVKD